MADQSLHAHDRYLYEMEGCLHFGCINPFCGHGDPALPNHYRVPLDSKDVIMRLLTHEQGILTIEVTPKDPQWSAATIICEDNLEACSVAFRSLKFEASKRRITIWSLSDS